MEHDNIKTFKISQVAHASIDRRGEHQIQKAEVSGLILTGLTCWFGEKFDWPNQKDEIKEQSVLHIY